MAARIAAVLIAALLLTGCANLPRVWLYGGYFDDAQTSAFRFSGAHRDFRTSVVGNPFGGPQSEIDRAVIAAMKGEDKGIGTHFTLTPRTNYKNYHIVMLFNPERETASGSPCKSPRSLGRKDSPGRTDNKTPLVLVALFCEGDALLYGVGGSRGGITSAGDPKFRALVKDVMDYFVPQHSFIDEPREDDNDND